MHGLRFGLEPRFISLLLASVDACTACFCCTGRANLIILLVASVAQDSFSLVLHGLRCSGFVDDSSAYRMIVACASVRVNAADGS